MDGHQTKKHIRQATLLHLTACRNGLFRGTDLDAVAQAMRRRFYANEEDAVAFAKQQQAFLGTISDDDTVDDEPRTDTSPTASDGV